VRAKITAAGSDTAIRRRRDQSRKYIEDSRLNHGHLERDLHLRPCIFPEGIAVLEFEELQITASTTF